MHFLSMANWHYPMPSSNPISLPPKSAIGVWRLISMTLVANAGISGPNLKAWEYPVETRKQIIDVDLNGLFLCCRAVVPFMVQQEYGPDHQRGFYRG